MHANQAARAESRAASLAAEAGRVGGVVDRQLVERQDFLAVQVGHRHLGGGDQIQVINLTMIHLIAKLRQLARAFQTLGFHEERGSDLRVAVLRGVQVEQEADERAL